MICKKCGNQIEKGETFCKKCGAQTEQSGKLTTGMTHKGTAPAKTQYLKLGITAACLLMALATVLPYMKFDREIARYTGIKSISLLYTGKQIGDGILFIILAIMAIVFSFLKKGIPVLVCGIIPFLMYCFEVSQLNNGSIADMYDYMSKGSGFYLITISVIALLILSILYFIQNRRDRKQNG